MSAATSDPEEQRGCASVELVAAIPALIAALMVATQLAAVGYALWSAGIAARAGARAAHVGEDSGPAARRSLPPALRRGAEVADEDGEVTVAVAAPSVLPGLPRLEIAAAASLEGDG